MEVQYQRFNSNQGDNCPVTPLPLPQSLYGRTDGRSDGRSYGHVITKFSWLDGLPKFLTHGAPLARFARWSSANINGCSSVNKLSPPAMYAAFNLQGCQSCWVVNTGELAIHIEF